MILATDADHDAPSPDLIVGFSPEADFDSYLTLLNRLGGLSLRIQVADGTDVSGLLVHVDDNGDATMTDFDDGEPFIVGLNFPAVITYL